MEAIYYVKDTGGETWETDFTIDYIKFDDEGKVDFVRETQGINYLLEENIKLPKLNTEYEYIEYLTGKYIHEEIAEHLKQLIGFELEKITLDWDNVNNAIFVGNPRGKETGIGWQHAYELLMEATRDWEFVLVEAVIYTMEVIRTLLHNNGELKIKKRIRI